jgi:hypothetical protein
MVSENLDNKLFYHSQVLIDLESFVPHAGQIPIGKAIFYDGKKRIFIECGRKFGKTEMIIYILYRWCMLYPNSWCYYIAPYQNQINDLVWANGRMPYFLSEKLRIKYGVKINNSEYRIEFRNGSFIKCDGSDNYEKGRGYSATGVSFYDEFKDQHPKFHDGFEANLAITDAPLVFVGTPPNESEDSYERWCSIADEVRDSETGFHICRPSMTNPHVSKEYFERKYNELKKKGELWKWEQEYMAQRVNAGSNTIFPMLDKEKHVRPYKDVLIEILNHHEDYEFFISFDPGTATVFGVLLGAIHRYSKKVHWLDEIYADNFATNSAGIVVAKARQKMFEIMPEGERWHGVYDYAATWFLNEYQTNYEIEGLFLHPCEKDLKNKENKLSLIKDMILGGFWEATDRCVKLWWEMTKYSTDEHGRIPKKNDHLIDNSRYILNAMRYDKIPQDRPKTEAEIVGDRRKITIEDDLSNLRSGDIYGSIDSDLYDN